MYVHHVRKPTYTGLWTALWCLILIQQVDESHRATSRAPCSRRRPPFTCTYPGVLTVYLCGFYLLRYILPISTKRGINTRTTISAKRVSPPLTTISASFHMYLPRCTDCLPVSFLFASFHPAAPPGARSAQHLIWCANLSRAWREAAC